MKIEMGIGWVPEGHPGRLRSATPSEYAAEIERLRAALTEIRHGDDRRVMIQIAKRALAGEQEKVG